MQVRVKKGALSTLKTDVYVIGLFKEDGLHGEQKELKDWPVEQALKGGDFNGDTGRRLLLLPSSGKGPRLVLLGLGERSKFTLKTITEAYGKLMIWLLGAGYADATVELPLIEENGPEPAAIARFMGRACQAGSWRFENYKMEPKGTRLKSLSFRASAKPSAAISKAFTSGSVIGEGVNFARDMAHHPANTVTPGYLANAAKSIAKASGGKVKATIMGETQLKKMGAGGILAVGQGSAEESRLIAMEYTCGKKNARKLAVIGKGITFDSGGISIKPSASMEDMKYDMCGAAAVFGLFSVIAELKPDIDVLGVVPTAENLPDGHALKPGDIIKLLCGKTVEVINTDAEGRLLLVDALAWAEKTWKPDAMIDFATLTGAVLIAFGHQMSAVMGNDPAMVEAVVDAGSRSGDTCWPMPLAEEFKAMIKSPIADIRNSTNTREAGTITAGCFLNEAVTADTPWAHVDIAGTAWMNGKPGYVNGPTGVGVHLLAELIDTFEF